MILYSSYAVLYVGTVPDIPNIHNILTNIQQFGRQWGLDESSGRKSATLVHGFAFSVDLMCSNINTTIEYHQKSGLETKPFLETEHVV